jgi:hypothetical protein
LPRLKVERQKTARMKRLKRKKECGIMNFLVRKKRRSRPYSIAGKPNYFDSVFIIVLDERRDLYFVVKTS